VNPGDGDPWTPPATVPPGPEPASIPEAGHLPSPSGPFAGDVTGWPGWVPDPGSARSARRAARAARREARRGERGLGTAIWGLLLVLLGAGILAAELVPGFDWDLAWPLAFVALGVVLVTGSIRRPPVDA